MAWNPIHLGKSGLLEGIEGLGGALGQMRARQDQRRMREEEMARLLRGDTLEQQRQRDVAAYQQGQLAIQQQAQERLASAEDRQLRQEQFNAKKQAAALLAQGRASEAQQLMQVYGLKLEDMVAGGSAAPDQMDGGQAMQAPRNDNERRAMIARTGGRVPVPPAGPRPPQDFAIDMYAPGEAAMHGAPQQQPQQAPQANAPVADIAAGGGHDMGEQESPVDPNARRAMMVKYGGKPPPDVAQRYRITGADGSDHGYIDPNEGRDWQTRERAGRAQEVATTFGRMRNPLFDRYGQEVVAGIEGGLIAPEKAMDYMRMRAEDDAMAEARMAAARRPRGGGGGYKPSQRIDDERSAVGGFETSYKNWEAGANVDKLTDQYDLFGGMAASAKAYREKGDVINQRKALYEAARFITGPGILRQEEYDNTVRKTSGWSDAIATKIRQNLYGDISDAEWAAMETFVANANSTLRNKAVRAVKNFDRKYHDKDFYRRNVPDQVSGARQSLLERFGLAEEDIAGAPDPNRDRARRADAARKGFDPMDEARKALRKKPGQP